jgi:hypothetical protein
MWDQAFGERLSCDAAESEAKRLIHFFFTLAEARVRDGKAPDGHFESEDRHDTMAE